MRFALSICLITFTTFAAASAEPLKGGVKSDAPLQPSVHVVPQGAGKPIQGGTGNTILQSGAGNSTLNGGAGIPSLQTGIPYQQYNGSHPVNNQIPPTTSYTFTPHTSTMQVPGTYSYTPGTQFRGVMNYDGASGTTQVQSTTTTGGSGYGDTYTSSRGVTTSSGYTIGRATVTPGTVAAEGPGSFSVYSRWGESVKKGLTYAPGFEPKSESTDGRLAYNSPSTSTTIFGAHNGVVTYVPGYEVTINTVGIEKQTVGGLWSIPEIQPMHALDGMLRAPKTFAQILSPDVHPLLAKAQLLPSLIPQNDKVLDWKLWYQRVAAAIYGRWKYADVGPGTATVRVTVTANREVSAQIINFEPAPDVERSATAETAFRETALHAVNLVTTAEIPHFPKNSENTSQVKFDVDMRRAAAGAAGYDVATTASGSGDNNTQRETEQKVTAEMVKGSR
jgi:hypothetical protein